MTFEIKWLDRGLEPKCPADPRYPEGVDLDVSKGAVQTCSTPLPYPAKRIGLWVVKCTRCRQTVVCTTAGRPDDPRFIKLACQRGLDA